MRYRITNKKKFIRFCLLVVLCIIFIVVGFGCHKATKALPLTQPVVYISSQTPETTIITTPLSEPTPEFEPRYGFTEDEIHILAVLLCGSKHVDGDGEYDFDFGNNERYDQISLVLCVVMNRVRNEQFPDTVIEVITQPNQFSSMKRWTGELPEVSDIALQRVREWCDAYDRYDLGIQSVPEDHLYFTGDGIENHSSTTW